MPSSETDTTSSTSRYRKRLAAGLCARCGTRPPRPNRNTCQSCADKAAIRERGRASRPQNEDVYRNWRYQRAYGITLEQYEALAVAQGGCCAICHQPPTKQRLHVDHDHATGIIRGLLCMPCNRAIGNLKDDPERARALLEYLTKESL